MRQAVRDFNTASASDKDLQVNAKRILVEDIQEEVDGKKADYRSGTMVADTVSGKIKPTVLSPGDESWMSVLKREWRSPDRPKASSPACPWSVARSAACSSS